MMDALADEAGVVARPMDELAVKNAKYAKDCMELHMARRGITHLVGVDEGVGEFHLFKNLEVLWINDNRISRLIGLEANFRIKVTAARSRVRS